MKKIVLMMFICFFVVSTANAFFISFDHTGAGSYSQFDLWDTSPYATQNSDTGDSLFRDIYTYQEASTGNFTETFRVGIDKGTNSVTGPSGTVPYVDVWADITLGGTYYSDSNIVFATGDISVKKGATEIATLNFLSGLPSSLSGSLNPPSDLGMKIDLKFAFDSVDSGYFGPIEQDLASKQWLLSVVNSRIDQNGLFTGDFKEDYDLLVGWQIDGLTSTFEVVPEPSTYILMGIGLVGLALYRRRKA